MHSKHETRIVGEITDVFAHRFVVRTDTRNVLADLGPKGADQVKLERGDRVELSGEMTPSELKVSEIALRGGGPIVVHHAKKPHPHKHHPHHDHEKADPAEVLRAVEARGFRVVAAPRRKPKHFEVLTRDSDGDLIELHVEFDGSLRKAKPVDKNDHKWERDLAENP